MFEKCILLLLSFFIVAFGQPAWSEILSLITAFIGFAFFWKVLLSIPEAKTRFFLSMGWFAAVQIVQFSWSLSHPYLYIYFILFFCAALFGAQWGLVGIGIKPENLKRFFPLLALAGLWTILEWSRLFLLSGLPFNAVGLTLTASLYSLQFASLGGMYGLSFWVILTNLLFLRAWVFQKGWGFAGVIAVLPFVFGWIHFELHKGQFEEDKKLNVVLVQSALPIEENLTFKSAEEARQFVLDEWRQVLSTLKKQMGHVIDLIVFPEYLVPYGTFLPVYPASEIEALFHEIFGTKIQIKDEVLTNAHVAQAIADFFQAHVMIGLEESTYRAGKKVKGESYSSAFHFVPLHTEKPLRYDKRVLLPMGEYIPFEWCRTLAASYGIGGSFTPGKCAKVFEGPVPFGASICYEEIFGDLMRENRLQGGELLVNLTNDGWYPNSRLPKQHFDHARLRTVENGFPLIRACNTGITGGIDSLGRIVGVLEEEGADSIRLEIPTYHYRTLYTQYGDFPVIVFSVLALLGFFKRTKT